MHRCYRGWLSWSRFPPCERKDLARVERRGERSPLIIPRERTKMARFTFVIPDSINANPLVALRRTIITKDHVACGISTHFLPFLVRLTISTFFEFRIPMYRTCLQNQREVKLLRWEINSCFFSKEMMTLVKQLKWIVFKYETCNWNIHISQRNERKYLFI